MKSKYYILTILLLSAITVTFVFQTNPTLALPDDIPQETTTLNYTQDKNELQTNIKNFVETYDDLLIALSSYEQSTILSENYDFLVRFSENYILDNIDKYEDKIEDNYIDIEEIYTITNNVFGKTLYYIPNTINNRISLTKDERRFELPITSLKITKQTEEEIIAKVNYEVGSYSYTFKIQDDQIYIQTIEVLE